MWCTFKFDTGFARHKESLTTPPEEFLVYNDMFYEERIDSLVTAYYSGATGEIADKVRAHPEITPAYRPTIPPLDEYRGLEGGREETPAVASVSPRPPLTLSFAVASPVATVV